ncbi:MAG: glutamine--fructose-6-phosphate transaminase (isomerizing), partial [Bdellovibrionota bacterium]
YSGTSGTELKKVPMEINWNPEMVEKQGFPHFMLKEIHEQPRAVAAAIEPHISRAENKVTLKGVGFGGEAIADLDKIDFKKDYALTSEVLSKVERVLIIACGTSYYAAQVGKYLIEHHAHIPVETDIASEFRYRENIVLPNTLVITISQSGETADTLAALRKVKERGARVLSICNVRNSSIDREAHGHLYLNAGPEIGVASTKAFTATIALINCFAINIGVLKGSLSREKEIKYVEALLKAPSQIEAVLNFDKYFDKAAETLGKFRGFLYMGRGVSFPIALEGALKLKELAYLHAEGYAAGEMKHGPLALIDEEMAIIMLAPQDALYDKTLSNLEEARARGGKIIAIGTGDNEHLRRISEHYLPLPKAHWTTNALLEVVPLQLMAYHLANHLGYDVDQPRNLAKSVTVE